MENWTAVSERPVSLNSTTALEGGLKNVSGSLNRVSSSVIRFTNKLGGCKIVLGPLSLSGSGLSLSTLVFPSSSDPFIHHDRPSLPRLIKSNGVSYFGYTLFGLVHRLSGSRRFRN